MPAQPRRITARITVQVQKTLQAAADLVGATLHQFVVEASLEKAERVLTSESTLLITRREALRVFELTQAPPCSQREFFEGPGTPPNRNRECCFVGQ